MRDLSELEIEIKKRTFENREKTMEMLSKYDSPSLVLILLETMKDYAQSDDILTGQYMMFLDSVQTILVRRKFIKKVNTWTLEEFLNDVKFHSEIVIPIEDHEESKGFDDS